MIECKVCHTSSERNRIVAQIHQEQHAAYIAESTAIYESLPAQAREFADWSKPMVMLYGRSSAKKDRELIWLEFLKRVQQLASFKVY